MNEQRYTPGPWMYQKPRFAQRAIGRKWEIVAPIPGGGENVIIGEHTGIDCLTEQNARLIAAAPELLEALKYVADAVDRVREAAIINNPRKANGMTAVQMGASLNTAAGKCRAALSKAKGG